MENKILVIGGTGTIGKPLIDLLYENEKDFKALVRSDEKEKMLKESGIETVRGELGNWPSVERAVQDIDTIFLLTGTSEHQVDHQNRLIDMAADADVKKVVKISAVGAKRGSAICLADWHGQIEEHLKKSGMRYVILRPHSFMQNILMQIDSIKEHSHFYHTIGETKIPMIDARDIARASYECLISDKFDNGTYSITGPQAISYYEVAQSLSDALGRKIEYINIPVEAHNRGLKEAGVPVWLADDLTLMNSKWTKNYIHDPTDDFSKISDSKQIKIDQFAKDIAPLFT